MTRWLRRALLGAALAAAAVARAQSSRLEWVDAELTGPLHRAEIELAPYGRTRLESALGAGESSRLQLPIPAGAAAWTVRDLERALKRVEPTDGGLRFLAPPDGANAARWDALPAGLRARPRPELAASRRSAPWSVLFALGAAFAVGMKLRRKPLAATLASLASCGVVALLLRSDTAAAPRSIRLIDGDPEHGVWISCVGARERLAELPANTLVLTVEPRDAALELEIVLARDGSSAVRAAARGASLWACGELDSGARKLAWDLNAWATLDAVWTRDESGAWRWRGAWPLGASSPLASEPAERERALPGWMNPALPQGVRAIIARLARDGAAPAGARTLGDTWIRVLGP